MPVVSASICAISGMQAVLPSSGGNSASVRNGSGCCTVAVSYTHLLVLCRGVNDGNELRRTLADLLELTPMVQSIAACLLYTSPGWLKGFTLSR